MKQVVTAKSENGVAEIPIGALVGISYLTNALEVMIDVGMSKEDIDTVFQNMLADGFGLELPGVGGVRVNRQVRISKKNSKSRRASAQH